jgi:hypothetical protein
MQRIWIAALLLGVSTCEAQQNVAPTQNATTTTAAPAATPVEPLFDCYQVNFAWGFTLSGRFVDQHGAIWSYGGRDKAHLPTATISQGKEYFKVADLQAKYVQPQQIGSVDAKTLAEKSALIAAAADGAITLESGKAFDAGSSSCHAYVKDETQQRYRDIEFGSDGGVSDTRITNVAPAAQELLTWLKSVGVAK